MLAPTMLSHLKIDILKSFPRSGSLLKRRVLDGTGYHKKFMKNKVKETHSVSFGSTLFFS